MAGKGKKAVKLIDDETFVFLGNQTKEDYRITARIGIEKHVTEFRYEHAERFNNWQTDELYIEQANIAEAAFLEKVHDSEMSNVLTRHAEDAASQKAIFEDQRTFNAIINEMKSLTVQSAQNKAAAERMKRAKAVLKERRNAVRQHLARIEARQDRERKSIGETQKRSLKQKKLVRGTVIRDVEDPEIRIIVGGLDFNAKTMAEENAKTNAVKAEADKKFHAEVLAQLVINTKEIEQIREEHLVHHKYATRYCERELEIIDENEALLFEHTAKEQKLEAAQKVQIDAEEDRISVMVAAGLAHQAELRVKEAAASIRESQRKEARRLKAQQAAESAQRENEFWEQEEVFLMGHLKEKNLEARFDELKKEFLNRKNRHNSDFAASLEDEEDDEDGNNRLTNAENNIEAQRARELALLEGLKKEHRQALKRMKAVHLKIREQNRAEQQKSLKSILDARDEDIASLKTQQAKEMADLKAAQSTNKHGDDKNNDRIYAKLPKSIGEALKAGQTVSPKAYDHLTFLTADIANGAALLAKSSAVQYYNFVNKVYTAFDEVLGQFDDIAKIENVGDSYTLVSGVNHDGKNAKAVATNVVELGLTLVKIAKELDLTDQITDVAQVRVGIHTGPVIAGVPNPAQPKFAVLGDAPVVAGILEQTSRPHGVHVSGITNDLVKDKFESDVSESLNYKGARITTFWVIDDSASSGKKKSGRGGRSAQ
jgi:class 3 adenylate cyclase